MTINKNSVSTGGTTVMAAFLLTGMAAFSGSSAFAQIAAKATPKAAPKTAPAVPTRTAPANSQSNTLFMVGYAHLDTEWRWAYPQVIREFLPNTLHDNFALIEKYPDYVFNFTGSRRYEMMKEYYPEDFQKLKTYVKKGRWFPAGSSVDEGDVNVPSAESIIRHTLYGNHFFMREFGVASHEFMLPDCFGFPYALPTILTHSGIIGFSTQKLSWGSAIGIPFTVGNWEGPDGSRIIAALDPGAYDSNVSTDMSQSANWLARIQNTGKMSGAFVDYKYYGVGDRGGAPHDDSVAWVEKSLKGNGPVKVVSSRSEQMFLAITPEQKAKLPVYKGEMLLTQHSAGSITSEAAMKRWNRQNERLADSAERAAVAARWLGGPVYPSNRLYQAWNLVLGSQMHDSLSGTALPKVLEYTWNDELLALNQFAAVTNDSVGAIASAMDTRAPGTPVVVYNPLSIAREDVVEATVPITTAAPTIQVFGPDGKPVPTQILERGNHSAHLLFLAQMPSTGLAAFDVRGVMEPASDSALSVSKNRLENVRFRVTIDTNGDLASIYDKTNKREVLKAPARLALQHHNPSQYPAWNMDWADAQKPPHAFVDGAATIKIVEDGPVRAALEITRTTPDGSVYVQQVRLSEGSAGNQVEIENTIDWQTRESALKAAFPFTTGNAKATYDLQVGTTERTNNDSKKYEVPQHMWFDLTRPDKTYGVAVLNDSKYGGDKPDDDTMRLTLLYTPGVRGGYQDQAVQDFGRHNIRYAVAPHTGDWRTGGVPWLAKRFNRPLLAFVASPHPGRLGKTFGFLSTSSTQVEVSAIKKAEDTDEIIIRLRELQGEAANGLQIKMGSGIASAREVNGQEYPVGPAVVRNGTLVANVPAFGLRAFAVKLAPSSAKAAPVQTQTVPLPFDLDAVSLTGNLTDGAFDGEGRTFAGEQFPRNLQTGNIPFTLGSSANGAKNALICKGQTIALPVGSSRVYLLAASSAGDVSAPFAVGGQAVSATVQDWGGYVGQWDNRLWLGKVPELTYDWHNPWGGLTPGYIKGGEVAWFVSHRHHPQTGNEFYQYSYLYKIGFDVPKGAASLTLPADERIKIFAVTTTKAAAAALAAANPLYDTLDDRGGARTPRIVVPTGPLNDVTGITIEHPLYWHAGGLHYTLDGSSPTAASPVYSVPLELNAPTTIKAAEIDEAGQIGPVAVAAVKVDDTTAPQIVAAEFIQGQSQITLRFSEALDKASAEQSSNYRFSDAAQAKSATLGNDNRSVFLTLQNPLPPSGGNVQLSATGIKDTSPRANASAGQAFALVPLAPLFNSEPGQAGTPKRVSVAGLPTKARDPWTINLYVKADKTPENRTLLAGFGRARDGQAGTGRYFAYFDDGIRLWSANQDVTTDTPLDLGKWQMLTAVCDGTVLCVYKNGVKIGERTVDLSNDDGIINLMPRDAWENKRVFAGQVQMTVWKQALTQNAVEQLYKQGKTP